jgi:hypothetical protein
MASMHEMDLQCSTPQECAQKAVEAAAQAVEALKEVQSQLQSFQAEIDALKVSIGGGRVIGIAVVHQGKLNDKVSSPNVTFALNPDVSGTLSFPNPQNLRIVPILSYLSPNGVYATGCAFIKNEPSPSATSVIIRGGALDTSGRVFHPTDFTAIIVGFDDRFVEVPKFVDSHVLANGPPIA